MARKRDRKPIGPSRQEGSNQARSPKQGLNQDGAGDGANPADRRPSDLQPSAKPSAKGSPGPANFMAAPSAVPGVKAVPDVKSVPGAKAVPDVKPASGSKPAGGSGNAARGGFSREGSSRDGAGAAAASRASTASKALGSASLTRAPLPSSSSNRGRTPAAGRSKARQQAIPDAVANRMARRIAIATGIPTLMGMAVFIASYLLVSRAILDIPPSLTLLASGGCFLLGLVGLSYGVLSSSWEDAAGSLLGFEQIGLNITRLRDSVRAMRQGSSGSSQS